MSNQGGAVSRYCEREYGAQFTSRETPVAVGVTKANPVPYDDNRIALLVTNTGTTNITMTRDPNVVSGVGVLLLGNGSNMSLNAREDANAVAGQWYAISDVAGGSVFVEETIERPQRKETKEG
jgi:hypothetical protein